MTRIRKKVTEIKRYSDIVYISLIIAAITAILGTFSVLLRQINYCPKFVIIIFMSAFIVSSISALIFFKLIEKNVENLVLTQRQIVLKDKNYKTFRDLNNIEDVIFIQDIIANNKIAIYAIINNGGTVREYEFSKEEAGKAFQLKEF